MKKIISRRLRSMTDLCSCVKKEADDERGRSDWRAVKTCEEHGAVGPPGSRSTVFREANPVRSSLTATNLRVCSALLSAGRKYNTGCCSWGEHVWFAKDLVRKIGPTVSDTNIHRPQFGHSEQCLTSSTLQQGALSCRLYYTYFFFFFLPQ